MRGHHGIEGHSRGLTDPRPVGSPAAPSAGRLLRVGMVVPIHRSNGHTIESSPISTLRSTTKNARHPRPHARQPLATDTSRGFASSKSKANPSLEAARRLGVGRGRRFHTLYHRVDAWPANKLGTQGNSDCRSLPGRRGDRKREGGSLLRLAEPGLLRVLMGGDLDDGHNPCGGNRGGSFPISDTRDCRRIGSA
jgi:hypothetical protein